MTFSPVGVLTHVLRTLLAVPLLLVSLLPVAQPAAAASTPSVLTGFSGGGIYQSPDGNNLGGGGNSTRPYLGTPTTLLLPWASGFINGYIDGSVYFSTSTN